MNKMTKLIALGLVLAMGQANGRWIALINRSNTPVNIRYDLGYWLYGSVRGATVYDGNYLNAGGYKYVWINDTDVLHTVIAKDPNTGKELGSKYNLNENFDRYYYSQDGSKGDAADTCSNKICRGKGF